MSDKHTETTIEILGKTYQIKCPPTETEALQRAAHYLQDKISHVREDGSILNLDRIMIITALNVAHQLLTLEQQKELHAQTINQRLRELQNKVETALESSKQMELQPAE